MSKKELMGPLRFDCMDARGRATHGAVAETHPTFPKNDK